jgi:hypothetical protein
MLFVQRSCQRANALQGAALRRHASLAGARAAAQYLREHLCVASRAALIRTVLPARAVL